MTCLVKRAWDIIPGPLNESGYAGESGDRISGFLRHGFGLVLDHFLN